MKFPRSEAEDPEVQRGGYSWIDMSYLLTVPTIYIYMLPKNAVTTTSWRNNDETILLLTYFDAHQIDPFLFEKKKV